MTDHPFAAAADGIRLARQWLEDLDVLEIDVEALVDLWYRVKTLREELRALSDAVDAGIVSRLRLLPDRAVRTAAGKRVRLVRRAKHTVRADDAALLAALLAAAGGDDGILSRGPHGVLASGCWRVGAIKRLLGDAAPEWIDTVYEDGYEVTDYDQPGGAS